MSLGVVTVQVAESASEVLLGANPAILGPTTLLGLTVYLILRGHLVPRATLNDQKAETANWRTAYDQERTARSTAEAQTSELLSLARATNALLTALPKVGEDQ